MPRPTETTWQPISTAPKEKEIILWFPKKQLAITGSYQFQNDGTWEEPCPSYWWWYTTDDISVVYEPDDFPTHWMELPECPKP